MKTLSLNSKKCLTAEILAALLCLSSLTALAGGPPSQAKLVADMHARSGTSFAPLLSLWQNRYGTSAVGPLMAIARDKRNADRDRYVALMASARLGGPAIAEHVVPLLKDKQWMVRSAALKALAALGDPRTAKAALPLTHDPALVVRVEAIEAIRVLHPDGATQALLSVLRSQDNYRFGKAQWVPQRALNALAELQDRSVVPELRPLLDHQKDPELQQDVILALQKLTGIEGDTSQPLSMQIASWKKTLSRLSTTAQK